MKIGTVIGLLVLAAVLYVLLMLFFLGYAVGHEGEQWVADKQLNDPVSHEYCCGPSDCHTLPDNYVSEVRGGYKVIIDQDHDAIFIPYARALPFAPDGHYHICSAVTAREHPRCFIVPSPPS